MENPHRMDMGGTPHTEADLTEADAGHSPPPTCVDTHGPSRPGRPVLAIDSDGVELSWEESHDPSGVASYRVYRDGMLLLESQTPSARDNTSPTPSSTHAYWVEAVDGVGNVSARGAGASIRVAHREATANDSVDDDGDGWLETSYGFRLRDEHPRAFITAAELDIVLARMYGPTAREPYASWFQDELQAQARNPIASALAFRATGEERFLDEVIQTISDESPGSSGFSFLLLVAVDILFDDLPSASLQTVRSWAAEFTDASFGYNTLGFMRDAIHDPRARLMNNQHALYKAWGALLYAGIFAMTEEDAVPMEGAFPSLDYLRATQNNVQPEGWMWRNENHIAGDLELHPERLPGTPGGMFDTFGYDAAEESNSIWIWHIWHTLSGQPRHRGAYHDEYRGLFWLANRVPHSEKETALTRSVPVCDMALSSGRTVRPWTATSHWVATPNKSTTALLASRYDDPIAQYYAAERACTNDWNATNAFTLLHFDDAIIPVDTQTLPRAHYFSGPGMVTSRSAWDATGGMSVFFAGRGYGRRYEDASSFLLHRRGPIVVHTSKRARGGEHGRTGHWYHVRGVSKNGIRVYDPSERHCAHPDRSIVNSDALGGPVFETGQYAESSGIFELPGGAPCNEPSDAYVTSAPSAEVMRFEDGGDYTYALIDATYPYRTKVEHFERALVHDGDDALLIFDRLRVNNPEARRVWAAHIAPDPIVDDATQRFGWLDYGDSKVVRFSDADEVSAHVLLPEEHETRVRGGATVLWSGALDAGGAHMGSHLIEQPRWLVVRADAQTSVRVRGRAADGTELDETIEVRHVVYDERGGYAGNTNARFVELLSVEALSESAQLSVEIPHRFDAQSLDGEVFDFEPGWSSNGERRPDERSFGRHTLEIEAPTGDVSTNFLIALSLADQGITPAPFTQARGDNLVAAIRGDRAWIFVLDRDAEPGSISIPQEVTRALVMGLGEASSYQVDWQGELRIDPDGAATDCTSSSGTLELTR